MDVCVWTGALEHCCEGGSLNFIARMLGAGSIVHISVMMNCYSCTAVHTILHTPCNDKGWLLHYGTDNFEQPCIDTGWQLH